MILARPSVRAERWLVLARRLGLDPRRAPFAEETAPWRGAGPFTRAAFFALGLVAVGLAWGVVFLLGIPQPALVCGVLALVAGERLIGRGFFAAGIEEALVLGGALAVAYVPWHALGDPWRPGIVLCAGTAALAGVRLLNPLMTSFAGVLLSFAFVPTLGLWGPAMPERAHWLAAAYCFALALAALATGARRFERPSYDRMGSGLVLAMPVAGYLWLAWSRASADGFDYRHPGAWTDFVVPLAPLAFALLAFATGLRRRSHAPLVAAMLAAGCVGWELRRVSGWSTEVRLIVWGSVLLVASIAIERFLRRPRRGITSERVGGPELPTGLLEVPGAAVLNPAPAAPPAPGFRPGGGGFDGGGAGGSY